MLTLLVPFVCWYFIVNNFSFGSLTILHFNDKSCKRLYPEVSSEKTYYISADKNLAVFNLSHCVSIRKLSWWIFQASQCWDFFLCHFHKFLNVDWNDISNELWLRIDQCMKPKICKFCRFGLCFRRENYALDYVSQEKITQFYSLIIFKKVSFDYKILNINIAGVHKNKNAVQHWLFSPRQVPGTVKEA